MAKNKNQYKCSNCNEIFNKWTGQCPKCKEWNSLEEYISNSNQKTTTGIIVPVKMKDVKENKNTRILTGIDEFDRVVGGGLIDDSITVLSAPPGTGKSTLCMMIADKILEQNKTVVYASGEESASQLKNRADRLNLNHIEDMYVLDNTSMDDVIQLVLSVDADLVIVDSIQTFTLNEYLPSRAGNPTQVTECAGALQNLAKRSNKHRMILVIGQMNKEDELVGTRTLEHLVDTVLILDGNSDDSFRILLSTKNRFGDTGETGFFQMTETGLLSVENPSEFFLTERKNAVVGTSLTVLKEGSRSIIMEIESLVTPSFTPYPSRISECMNREQLNVLISILEQHCKMSFFNKNVVIKTQNNLKLKTSDSNLATIMSIVSSYYGKEIPLNTVFLADVGLTGELKKIPNIEGRLKELDRMKYEKVFISDKTNISTSFKHIQLIKMSTIKDVLTYFGFNKNKSS